MGCCASSPHSVRRYRDPADFDEELVPEDALPLRTFGQFRPGSVVIPDDIDGLPSTWIDHRFPSDPNVILYSAEMDQGRPFRCIRPTVLCWITPCGIAFIISKGIAGFFKYLTCDEACCWLRKEYSTRANYLVYPNRIVTNNPTMRIPFGFLGCGSWSADAPLTHVFDRGAFGFRRVNCGVINYICCTWPVYGQVVARQRCPCNGPLWSGGWWCDEWLCDMFFCTYRYYGLADADEVCMASSIALQAYFEGRNITKEDMDKCLEYWRNNVSERHDMVGRKRDVMCEPFCVPWYDCSDFYECCHPKRNIPYKKDDDRTAELQEVYDNYEKHRQSQINEYKRFYGPVRNGTCCRKMGCRRVFGRRGCIFCTEGCCDGPSIKRGKGDPAPPTAYPDYDDDNDAAKIMLKVLGDPPPNVQYKRWERNSETGEFKVVTIQRKSKEKQSLVAKEGAVEKGNSLQESKVTSSLPPLPLEGPVMAPSVVQLTSEDGVETAAFVQ